MGKDKKKKKKDTQKKTKGTQKLILVESTEPVDKIQEKLLRQNTESMEVELWVRTPDDPNLEKMVNAARLCRCRAICIVPKCDADDE